MALDPDTRAAIEVVPDTAAQRLESWGFPPPPLEPVVTNEAGEQAYRVYLVTGRAHYAAFHEPRPCPTGTRETVIVLARFNDVAAKCWDVELEGYAGPVTLAVTASYRTGTEAQLGQLTAVMTWAPRAGPRSS